MSVERFFYNRVKPRLLVRGDYVLRSVEAAGGRHGKLNPAEALILDEVQPGTYRLCTEDRKVLPRP